MKESRSYAQGSICYEKLRIVNDVKTPGHELRVLDAMNNSRLWMT